MDSRSLTFSLSEWCAELEEENELIFPTYENNFTSNPTQARIGSLRPKTPERECIRAVLDPEYSDPDSDIFPEFGDSFITAPPLPPPTPAQILSLQPKPPETASLPENLNPDDSGYDSETFSDNTSDCTSTLTESYFDESDYATMFPQSQDDFSLLFTHPKHNIDYLSHSWELGDYRCAWRALQRDDVERKERLRNAMVRSWVKRKFTLGECNARSLKWDKDDDYTWLYGPFYSSPALNSRSKEQLNGQLAWWECVPKPALKTKTAKEILLAGVVVREEARKAVRFQ
ncbi:hypothetical protein G7Y89_g9610 [Cudoniella acicularis]|uniref:Uncharacterized protein n=1 Tax=Cudoniella acicularis TaxID=354080 RepID=A0A8H4VZG9_9HELO|nr:hypothetical protein G7Y89_g9610 [Cudoniella acicularis]